MYIATHGMRDIGPDPGHNGKGFDQLVEMRKLLAFLEKYSPGEIKLIQVGEGNRFAEMYQEIKAAFPKITFEYVPAFGGRGSRIDYENQESEHVTSGNVRIPASQVRELCDLFTHKEMLTCLRRIEWMADRTLGGDVLILAGSVLLRSIKAPSKSASIYRLKPGRRIKVPTLQKGRMVGYAELDIVPMMEDGEIVWENIELV